MENVLTLRKNMYTTQEIADSLGVQVGDVRNFAFRLFGSDMTYSADEKSFIFTAEQEEKLTGEIEKTIAKKLPSTTALESVKITDAEIKVNDTNGMQTVSARELHEKLGSNERFSKWWERFASYGFEENADFTCVPKRTEVQNNGGIQIRELIDYEITIDTAKQICMLQRTKKGRAYREYFIKIEKAWNTPEAIMARALQFANMTLDNARKEIAVLQPKADYYDKICDAENLTEIGTVGKNVGIGSQKFFRVLSEDKIIRRRCVDGIDFYEPYYGYEKYFKSVPVPFGKDGKKKVRNKLMFVAEGVVWAMRRYGLKEAV